MFGKRKQPETLPKASSTEIVAAMQDAPAKDMVKEAGEYFDSHYLGMIGKPFDDKGNMDPEVMTMNLLFAIYAELYKKNN